MILQDLAIMGIWRAVGPPYPREPRYDPVGLVEEFRKTILLELDFGAKGGMLIGSGSICATCRGIVIPQVFWNIRRRVCSPSSIWSVRIARSAQPLSGRSPPHCRPIYTSLSETNLEDGFLPR